jgi:hypothetical protein
MTHRVAPCPTTSGCSTAAGGEGGTLQEQRASQRRLRLTCRISPSDHQAARRGPGWVRRLPSRGAARRFPCCTVLRYATWGQGGDSRASLKNKDECKDCAAREPAR